MRSRDGDLFRLCPPPPSTLCSPQLQSTCHYIVNHFVKILHVHLGVANNMHPLSWGGGHKRKRSRDGYESAAAWGSFLCRIFTKKENQFQNFNVIPSSSFEMTGAVNFISNIKDVLALFSNSHPLVPIRESPPFCAIFYHNITWRTV